MSITRRTGTRIAIATTAGVLTLGATAGGIAYASSGSDSPSSSPSPAASSGPAHSAKSQHTSHHKHGPLASAHSLLAGRALHGDVVVKGKSDGKSGSGSYVTLQGQRGAITSVSSSSLSVKSADGFTATYALGDKTKVRVQGATSSASGLKPGQAVDVVAAKSGSSWAARVVVVPKPKTDSKKSPGKTN